MSLGAFTRAVGASFKESAVQAVIVGVIGAAVGWIGNVWYMAVRYDGFRVPPGAPATGEGSGLAGPAFWAMAGVVVFGLIGYRKAVGGKQFWRDIRSFPAVIGSLFTRDGRPALVHLLWGFAIAVLIAVLLSPAVSGILGLGILILLPSLLGGIFADMIARAVRSLMRRVAPGRETPETATVSAAVGMTGAVIALLIAFMVSSRVVKLVLAVVAGFAALIVGQQMKGRMTPRLALMAIGLPAAFAVLAMGPPAMADDGGWRECGSAFSEWWNCAGSGRVKRLAVNGAVSSGTGAALGFIIGTACGALGGSLASVLQVRVGDRLVDARGRPLVVNDGSFQGGRVGQVWFEDRWMDRDQAFSVVEQQRVFVAGEQLRLEAEWADTRVEADQWFDARLAEAEAAPPTDAAVMADTGAAGRGESSAIGEEGAAPTGTEASTGAAGGVAGAFGSEAWADRPILARDGSVDTAALDGVRGVVHERLALEGAGLGTAAVGGADPAGRLDFAEARHASSLLSGMPAEMGDPTVEGLRLGLTEAGPTDLPVRESFVGDLGSAGAVTAGATSQSVGGAIAGWGDALREALTGMLSGRDVLEVVQEAGGVEEQVDPFEMLGPDPEEEGTP